VYAVASGAFGTLTNGKIFIYPVASAWKAEDVSWNKPPVTETVPIDSVETNKVGLWESFTITNHVKKTVENGSNNYGYLFKFKKPDLGLYFYPCDYSDQKLRPKLIVTYTTGAVDTEKPKISITAPQNGTVLKPGSKIDIQWSATDNTGVVSRSIYYSITNDSTWIKIDSSSGNTGIYSWTIPNIQSSNFKIKITAYDAAGNFASIVSKPFSINSTRVILNNTSNILAKEYAVTVFSMQGKKINSFTINNIYELQKKLHSGVSILQINGRLYKIINSGAQSKNYHKLY